MSEEREIWNILYRPLSDFMKQNVIYFSWTPKHPCTAGAGEWAEAGEQSPPFHLPLYRASKTGSNIRRDYALLNWKMRLLKNCGRKCRSGECILLQHLSYCLGSFRVSATLVFQREPFNVYFGFQHFEFWITSIGEVFHNVVPTNRCWTTIHLFLEYLPNVPDQKHCMFENRFPPLLFFEKTEKAAEPYKKYLTYLYETREDETIERPRIRIRSEEGGDFLIEKDLFVKSSEVFENMFSGNFRETVSGSVGLPYSNCVVEQIIHYLYFGTFKKEPNLDAFDYVNLCMFFYEYDFQHAFEQLKDYVSFIGTRGPIDDFEQWIGLLNWLCDNKTDIFPKNFYSGLIRLLHACIFLTNREYEGIKRGVLAEIEQKRIIPACINCEYESDTA